MDIFAPQVIVTALVGRMLIKRLFKFDLEVLLGTIVYFVYLVTTRILRGSWALGVASWNASRNVHMPVPQKKQLVTNILDVNSVYRLNGLEVVLGFDRTGRPLRVDLDKYHTLISGTTGSGKSNLVNQIIAQLVARPYFKDEYDLYLIDLKNGHDYLELWKPVIKGYYSLDSSGTSAEAVLALKELVETMHVQDDGKRKVVIIDEVANLTSQSTDPELKKHGFAILMRISAQLRDVGALIAATQRPHFQTIERGVTANLERKISMRTDDEKDAKLTLRFQPQTDCTKFSDGEFLLKEPGAKNREQLGRTILVKVPQEIDQVVANIIEITAETDERVKIFKLAASSLSAGDTLPGVRREFWKQNNFQIEQVRTAYKNFHNAGAVQALIDKRGQPNSYVLSGDFGEGYRKVIGYIQSGKWESAPETIGKVVNE